MGRPKTTWRTMDEKKGVRTPGSRKSWEEAHEMAINWRELENWRKPVCN